MYPRLRAHFQFINELQLFAEVDHHTKYSINLYGPPQDQPAFDHLANLFAPATVDACYAHDGIGTVGGIKAENGKWNVAGHRDCLVRVTDAALGVFAQLYDEPGTPPRCARLPALHAEPLKLVLDKLAAYPRRLANLGEDYFSTIMFDESAAQRDGTIHRRTTGDNGFVTNPSDLVLSGPHFFVGNPFNKTPRRVCAANGHYDPIDLEVIPDDYLPRTNYHLLTDYTEYLRRIPVVSWREADEVTLPWEQLSPEEQAQHPGKPGDTAIIRRQRKRRVTEYFRLVHRKMLAQSGERTLIPALAPPLASHIITAVGTAFLQTSDLLNAAAAMTALIFDFYVKSQGRADFTPGELEFVPQINSGSAVLRGYSLRTASPPTTPPSGPRSLPPTSPNSAGASLTTRACRRTSSPASRPPGSATARCAPTTPAAWRWWRSTCWRRKP
jgi:hypothetical protein